MSEGIPYKKALDEKYWPMAEWVLVTMGRMRHYVEQGKRPDKNANLLKTLRDEYDAPVKKKEIDRRDWSEAELDYIREHYSTKTAREIGDHIGRKEYTVKTRANMMGLTKRSKAYAQ